jgi:hypothetical protein
VAKGRMDNLKKIALIGAICVTIVYEVILFTTLIGDAYPSQYLSIFFTFLFSLAGAAPIALILIIFTEPQIVIRYGEVEDSNSDSL